MTKSLRRARVGRLGSRSPFEELDIVLRLSLLPHALSNAMAHIRTILSQLLMRCRIGTGGARTSPLLPSARDPTSTPTTMRLVDWV